MLNANLGSGILSVTACLYLGLAVPSSGQQEKEPAKELTYKAPKGWRELEGTQFLLARFQVTQGDATATASIAVLRAPGGGLVANINRWRNQIGLDSLKDEEVLKATKEVKIDSLKGHFIDLTGPEKDGKPSQRILGGI